MSMNVKDKNRYFIAGYRSNQLPFSNAPTHRPILEREFISVADCVAWLFTEPFRHEIYFKTFLDSVTLHKNYLPIKIFISSM